MANDHVEVKVTADVADLRGKLDVAKTGTSALTEELKKLGNHAINHGMDALSAGLSHATSASQKMRDKATELGGELKDHLNSAHHEGGAAARVFAKGLNLAGGAAEELGSKLSLAGVVDFGKDVLLSTSELTDQAEQAGVTVEQLQAYRLIMQQNGATAADASAFIEKVSSKLYDASKGSADAAQSFSNLGLNWKDLIGLSRPEILQRVAQALLSQSDAGRQAAGEIDFMGRSSAGLTAALPHLAKNIDDVAASLSEDGLITSSDDAKEAKDSVDQLSRSWDKLVAASAAPVNFLVNIAAKGAEILGIAVKNTHDLLTPWDEMSRARLAINFDRERLLSDKMGNTAAPTLKADAEQLRRDEEAYRRLFEAHQKQNAASRMPRGVAPLAATPPAATKPNENLTQDDGGKSPPPGASVEARGDADQQGRRVQIARQSTEQIARIETQARETRKQGEIDTNNFLLEMGQESVDRWHEQALKLEDDRYHIELEGLRKREGLDAGDKQKLAEDLAQEDQLAAEHTNRRTAIDQDYARKKKDLLDKQVQDFIKDEDAQLKAGVDAIEQDYEDHKIGAQQRHDLEVALTKQIAVEALKRFDLEHATDDKNSQAYKDARKKLEDAIATSGNAVILSADKKLGDEQRQVWNQISGDIKSSVNSAFDDILFHGKSLGAGLRNVALGIAETFLHAGEKIVEDWIETQIKQEIATIAGENTKNAAMSAGEEARQAILVASGEQGAATKAALDSKSIVGDAYKAAAATYASLADIPVIGPIIAPVGAAAAFAAVMAFDVVSAEGGLERVGRDGQIAELHRDESVLPARISRPLLTLVENNQAIANIGAISRTAPFDFSGPLTAGRSAIGRDASDAPGGVFGQVLAEIVSRGGNHQHIHVHNTNTVNAVDGDSVSRWMNRADVRRAQQKQAADMARAGFAKLRA